MKDELKDFIQQNRADFDDKQPPERVWSNVHASFFQKTAWLQPIRYWQAAAIMLFGLSVFLLTKNDTIVNKHIAIKEFSDTEAFYTQQIADKMKMIHSISSNDLNGFTNDFQQLEAMYMVLREELNQHPSEKVKDALILNLLVRINLLNKQLQEAEEVKEIKKQEIIS